MDALERTERAVGSLLDDQSLGLEPGGAAVEAEVDHGLDPSGALPAVPGLGHGRAESEPGRPPRRPPRGADVERFLLVGRRPRRHVEGNALHVHEREDPLPELTIDPAFGELTIVVHAATVSQQRSGSASEHEPDPGAGHHLVLVDRDR